MKFLISLLSEIYCLNNTTKTEGLNQKNSFFEVIYYLNYFKEGDSFIKPKQIKNL